MQNRGNHKCISIITTWLLLSLLSISGKQHNQNLSYWKPERERDIEATPQSTHSSTPTPSVQKVLSHQLESTWAIL